MSNPMSGESANPLSGAKVIAVNANPDEYHRQKVRPGNPSFVMSKSALADFTPCPAKWIAGLVEKDTKATLWGSLIDCLALTPERFDDRYVVQPETYTDSKGAEKEWTNLSKTCRAWSDEQEAKGIKPIAKDEIMVADAAVKLLTLDTHFAPIIQHSQKQVWIEAVYADEETGVIVPIKCLIDMVPDALSGWPKALADLKTTRNASAWAWGKQLMESWYHVQAALYLDAYTLATGEDRVDFLHIVQENEPPYQTARRMLAGDLIERGRLKYVNALKRYCRCLKENHWPDYDEESGRLVNGFRLIDEGDVPGYLID